MTTEPAASAPDPKFYTPTEQEELDAAEAICHAALDILRPLAEDQTDANFKMMLLRAFAAAKAAEADAVAALRKTHGKNSYLHEGDFSTAFATAYLVASGLIDEATVHPYSQAGFNLLRFANVLRAIQLMDEIEIALCDSDNSIYGGREAQLLAIAAGVR